MTYFYLGYHNYHHRYPFDYKNSEWSNNVNYPKYFIELMAKFGWAFDLRSVPVEIVERAKLESKMRPNEKRSYERNCS